ncbi:hypothetical protein [Trichormus variabilis]|uniref:Uncharacterized protein n=1 Tax=Trichormus variabilis SAG 1403-4b TaxID=447716 RepID=A0A433V1W2_ANAVA|nr:hypothetical protein [Trichormus variabilis]MBD2627131.1 hypothetical protein [Trichormus variabilis FACHB-164]RUT00076.1 hypothetical protein DSM107003_06590 [Trichormus variabilis SAG 1403-4b]
MITEEKLATNFNTIIEEMHPRVWELLSHCYVKVITPCLMRSCVSPVQYIGIYCPDEIFASLVVEKNLLREVAKYLGLAEVVCLNATKLLRDPLSRVKKDYPHLWLELLWITTETQEYSS